MESYKLLLKEKSIFYGDESLELIEEKKLDKVIKRKYLIKEIYYEADGHNFFKRKDRYKFRVFLIICFSFFTVYNAFEFVDSIFLYTSKEKSDEFDNTNRITTLSINMINILFILILTTVTIIKLKIQTYVYY